MMAKELLWWPVVKNPPCNVGDTGLIPGQGIKMLHAAEQLNLQATISEPTCSRTRMPQLESPCASMKDPA